LLNKYLKCSVWRLALRYDIYIYMSLGFKRLNLVRYIKLMLMDQRISDYLKTLIPFVVSALNTFNINDA